MIYWGWLIAAFYAGLFAGIFVLAICSSAKEEDRQRAAMIKDVKEDSTHD